MTVYAGGARPASLFQIPVAQHSSMQTHVIIFPLRAVALRTHGHHVAEFHHSRIGHTQRVVIVRVMTTQARQVSVRILEPLMKLIQVGRRPCLHIRLRRRMARTTRHHRRLPVKILETCCDSWRSRRAFYNDRVQSRIRFYGDGRLRLGTRFSRAGRLG